MTEDQAYEIVKRVMSDETPLDLRVRIMDLWMVLSVLQLGERHPGISEATREFIHHIGRQFQAAIVAAYPEANPLIEMGWDPEMDRE